MDVAWGVLIPTVVAISLFFVAVAALVFRSQISRTLSGSAALVGERGTAYTDLDPEGQVFVHGEYWKAASDELVHAGETVEVLQVTNLKLRVRRVR